MLAIHGGPKSVTRERGDLTTWPIITDEDEKAVVEVLRRGAAISNWEITLKFEEEFCAWQGCRYAITYPNGTAAILAAMFGMKIGVGDEIICPSITYWASVLQSYSLGATPVFAEIDPDTLCLDPSKIAELITPRTKAIVVVHYCGYPADMDAIMEVANQHGIPVFEDVSHAQGGLYKGRKTGSFGFASAASLMAQKSLVAGEAGIAWTDDKEAYDRMVAWGHYNRFKPDIETEYLRKYAGLPLGGNKGRLSQMSSALGRVQLKHYDERCTELRKAMNYFWDCLEGVPGLRAHRVDEATGSTMAGWYSPKGHYLAEELGGLSITAFSQAVNAEGAVMRPGCNLPLHMHPLFIDADFYGHGKPTRNAWVDVEINQPPESLPVSKSIGKQVFGFDLFVHYRPELIEEYANAFRKVAENYEELLENDPGDSENIGAWGLSNF